MSTDAELLRRYADERSEAAFAELVRRHLNLVYFAALRQMGGDAHRAQDVAQSVFTDLARKAGALAGRTTLTGWLYTSTRFAATKARRAESTRQRHEQEVTLMTALLHDPDPAAEWERLRPMIDDVLHELNDVDREAVLLRYFENRPFADVGAALHLSDAAARMRVDRALEKLRVALARRGVVSTSAALAAAFGNQVGATVPAGLAVTISSMALAGAGVPKAAGVGMFFMSKITSVILGAVASVAVGTAYYQWTHVERAGVELSVALLERDNLRAQFVVERQQARRLAKTAAVLQSEVDALKAKQAAPPPAPPSVIPLPRFTPNELAEMSRFSMNQAILNNLRQIAAARDFFQKKNGRPPASLDELVGESKLIKRLNVVDGENYAALALGAGPLVVVGTDGTTVTYDPSAPASPPRPLSTAERQVRDLAERLKPAVMLATEAYRAAHNGAQPTNLNALLPYFATPQEGADFVELLTAANAGRGGR